MGKCCSCEEPKEKKLTRAEWQARNREAARAAQEEREKEERDKRQLCIENKPKNLKPLKLLLDDQERLFDHEYHKSASIQDFGKLMMNGLAPNSRYDFIVMDDASVRYFNTENIHLDPDKYGHSSMLSSSEKAAALKGQSPVVYAGMVHTGDSGLDYWNNNSGHFGTPGDYSEWIKEWIGKEVAAKYKDLTE